MDNQLDVVSQFEPDDLEEVACGIRADGEHFLGIRVGVEVDNGEGMLIACLIAGSAKPCLNSDRWNSTSRYIVIRIEFSGRNPEP